MKKYLIIKCKPLNDQYECDADRTPLKITDDYSEFNKNGYEIWEIVEDGNLTRIKEWEDSSDKGMALYSWGIDENVFTHAPVVIQCERNKTRADITKGFIKAIKKKVGFKDPVENIYIEVVNTGSHGEEINGRWVVYGEYADDDYSCGY